MRHDQSLCPRHLDHHNITPSLGLEVALYFMTRRLPHQGRVARTGLLGMVSETRVHHNGDRRSPRVLG